MLRASSPTFLDFIRGKFYKGGSKSELEIYHIDWKKHCLKFQTLFQEALKIISHDIWNPMISEFQKVPCSNSFPLPAPHFLSCFLTTQQRIPQ